MVGLCWHAVGRHRGPEVGPGAGLWFRSNQAAATSFPVPQGSPSAWVKPKLQHVLPLQPAHSEEVWRVGAFEAKEGRDAAFASCRPAILGHCLSGMASIHVNILEIWNGDPVSTNSLSKPRPAKSRSVCDDVAL